MYFEWDENKNAKNMMKHGIDFRDALGVFYDSRAIIKADNRRDYGEKRESILGICAKGLVTVVFTERYGNTIRLISARHASRKERRLYAPNMVEVSDGNS